MHNIVAIFVDGQICIENIAIQGSSNLTVPKGSQVIMPSRNFSCHGRVTSFVVYLNAENVEGSSYPYIQIWHPESDNMYTKIKEFSIDNGYDELNNDKLSMVRINVTGDDGVVEPDDCIGYYQPSDSHLVRNLNNTGHISHRITVNNSLNEFLIDNDTEIIFLQPAITILFGKIT